MIPKIIHYCWFGGNPKPELAVKCMESWKKYCPDYSYVEWNEDIFDLSTAPLYVRQAYEAKRWAFVTDYVRLYALYNQGGIYMDTDVEVIHPLDGFLHHSGFSGFEDDENIPTGIMAAEVGHTLIQKWMKLYDTMRFILDDGSYNIETNVTTLTHYMSAHGLKLNNTLQTAEDFTFYPKDYFCPKSYMDGKTYLTDNTHTIHHFSGSWLTEEDRKNIDKERRFQRRVRVPKKILKAVMSEDAFNNLKRAFGRGIEKPQKME
ncbi:MAG: glycosyl transferase [Parasporobacterium sp.]|nr:glycosyl transferase [Parasporobacterium sp.]